MGTFNTPFILSPMTNIVTGHFLSNSSIRLSLLKTATLPLLNAVWSSKTDIQGLKSTKRLFGKANHHTLNTTSNKARTQRAPMAGTSRFDSVFHRLNRQSEDSIRTRILLLIHFFRGRKIQWCISKLQSQKDPNCEGVYRRGTSCAG
jgi:hypothetical protein